MEDNNSPKELEDKILTCSDCGNRFIWTVGEQKFFAEKGLTNPPKRCKVCAAKNKQKIREKHPIWWIKCKTCGKKAEVPFEPKSDDIYCKECFALEIEKRNKAIEAMGEKVPE